jgi:uncharacterized membrane protein
MNNEWARFIRLHNTPGSESANVRIYSRSVITLIFAFFVFALLSPETLAKGKPTNPGGGGATPSTSLILPTSLGLSANCGSAWATDLNTDIGHGFYVVAQGGSCTDPVPGAIHALLWSSGSGMTEILIEEINTGSSAEGISDTGIVVGWFVSDAGLTIPFYLEPGASTASELPISSDMTWGNAQAISNNGRYIVGNSGNNTPGQDQAVRWQNINGYWQAVDLGFGACFNTPGVSDDGTIIANSGYYDKDVLVGIAKVRTLTQMTWDDLPGVNIQVHGIAASGDWIVGHRNQPCQSRCTTYPVPVYWKLVASGWTGPFDLPALDGVDSEAESIAQRGGKKLIVGHGYTKKDAIMRAVAWIEQPDGSFKLTRLEALNGKSKSWASAVAINNVGEVVGTSQANGLTVQAVKWALP